MKWRSAISCAALVAAAASTRALQALAGAGGGDGPFAVRRSEGEGGQRVSPETYAVVRRGEPEKPFSSPLLGDGRHGAYGSPGCEQDLCFSGAKFDGGTG